MNLRLTFIAIAISSLALGGCGGKKDNKKQPGSAGAQGAPVQPQGQPVAADKTGAPAADPTAATPAPTAATPAPTAAKPAQPTTAPATPEAAKATGPSPREAHAAAVKNPKNLKVENRTPPAATPPAAPEKRITGPVALVNGKAIDSKLYYAEVDKIASRSSKIPPERMNRIKENILKRLIEKELIRQAVKNGAVTVPAAEIDAEFAEYKKRFRTEDQFKNYLKHGKVTIDSIRGRIQEKKELEKLLEKSGKLAVTDEEVQEFYTKNQRFYQEREGVKARHILIKVKQKDTPEKEAEAKAKLEKAQAALKGGMKFEEAAKKFSEGPSAPKGGDLGFFGRGQMVKPFEEKAFTMKPNDVSEPIRTRFGWHIIQVLEKRESRKKDLAEVKSTITDSLRNKKFFQERRAMLTKLKKDAKIDRKIVIPKAPARPAPTRVNPHGKRPVRAAPTGASVHGRPVPNPRAPTGGVRPVPRRAAPAPAKGTPTPTPAPTR